MSDKHQLPVGSGVFVLSEQELKSLELPTDEMVYLKKFYDEREVHSFAIREQSRKYLLYLTRANCPDISNFPTLENHLKKYMQIMQDRRETKNGSNQWYQLHWPREPRYFEQPKIVLPGMFDSPPAGYQEEPGYFGLSSNIIINKDNQFELKYLLGLLNSSFANYWFKKHGKKRGVGVDIGVTKLKEFPVKDVTRDQQKEITKLVDDMIIIASTADITEEVRHSLNTIVYNIYGLTSEEVAIVEASN
jgi:adenine-specific DNA-methyltransferase